ncbi:MAG TPA: hypothetical protein DEF51_09930 [Myxococcales bacterium]|nr:hypothetical protein [Myxococcales bacterium]
MLNAIPNALRQGGVAQPFPPSGLSWQVMQGRTVPTELVAVARQGTWSAKGSNAETGAGAPRRAKSTPKHAMTWMR